MWVLSQSVGWSDLIRLATDVGAVGMLAFVLFLLLRGVLRTQREVQALEAENDRLRKEVQRWQQMALDSLQLARRTGDVAEGVAKAVTDRRGVP